MIKCPNCHGSKTALVKYKNSKMTIEYRYDTKEVAKQIRPRVCLDCGTIFVAKTDCEAIKREMLKKSEGHDE